jgi:hypothetical protein
MDVYERFLLEAIRERIADERWYRVNRWAVWTDLRRENRAVLRALVKLARHARKAERLAEERREQAERLFLETMRDEMWWAHA